jgi:hypothetical protein
LSCTAFSTVQVCSILLYTACHIQPARYNSTAYLLYCRKIVGFDELPEKQKFKFDDRCYDEGKDYLLCCKNPGLFFTLDVRQPGLSTNAKE